MLVSNLWLIARTAIRGRDCACHRQSVALVFEPRYVLNSTLLFFSECISCVLLDVLLGSPDSVKLDNVD